MELSHQHVLYKAPLFCNYRSYLHTSKMETWGLFSFFKGLDQGTVAFPVASLNKMSVWIVFSVLFQRTCSSIQLSSDGLGSGCFRSLPEMFSCDLKQHCCCLWWERQALSWTSASIVKAPCYSALNLGPAVFPVNGSGIALLSYIYVSL